MRAEKPSNDAARLAELHQFAVLDSGREKEFDDIVNLAAAICERPISLISLVDDQRQWFKARTGFALAETPIEESVCAHVILEDGIVEIEDATKDARTADNPLVTAKDGFKSYAAAQLKSKNGLPIGTLCVLGDKPGKLTDIQRETLRVLAKQVMTQLELRRAIKDHEVLNNEMDHRVKNSLQTVLSLIRLYRGKVKDPEARDAFEAIERRLNAIIMLHRELHRSSTLEQIDMSIFLPSVIDLLNATTPSNISVKQHISPIMLDSAQASSLAVVVNEFVANGIKHAFPDNRIGEIHIGLTQETNGDIILTCRDNGIGIAGIRNTIDPIESLGTQIMEASANQIGAKLARSADESGYHMSLILAASDD